MGGEDVRATYTVKGKRREIMVDGYNPVSSTVYQFYGCKWHSCHCQGVANDLKYLRTLERDNFIRGRGYNVVSVWECQSPELSRCYLRKEFIPYPYLIVFDFEALLRRFQSTQTQDLTINFFHIPVSVAINDNLMNEPIFLEDRDLKALVQSFVENFPADRNLSPKRFGGCTPW